MRATNTSLIQKTVYAIMLLGIIISALGQAI